MSTRPFRCSLCHASFVSRNEVRKHKLTCTGGRRSPHRDSPPHRYSRGFVGSYAVENTQILKNIVQVCEGYKNNSNQPDASLSSLPHDANLLLGAPQPHSNQDQNQTTIAATTSKHIETPTTVHADDEAILRVSTMFNIDDPQNLLNYSHQVIPDLALTHTSNSNGYSPRKDDYVSFGQMSTSNDDDGMSSSQESLDGDGCGDDAPCEEGFDADALAAIAEDVDVFSIPTPSLGTPTNDEQQASVIAL